MSGQHRLHRVFVRVLPKRLGTRFALTMLLSSLVAVTVISTFLLLAMSVVAPRIEDASVTLALDSIDLAIEQQASTAEASLAVLGVSTRIADAARSGVVPDDLATTLDAFARAVDASALVLTNLDGDIVYTGGNEADAFAVREALHNPSWEVPGVLAVDGAMDVVATRDVTGPEGISSFGQLGLSIPFASQMVAGAGSLTILEPESESARDVNVRIVEDPRFDDILTWNDGRLLYVQADIRGIDGKSAATILYETETPLRSWHTTVIPWALAAATLAILSGFGIGIAVARAIVKPIVDLADTMGDRAALAMAGTLPESTKPNDVWPLELSNLLEVFDATFTELTEHQAALAEAKENALAAKTTLDIAFQDSHEGKILIVNGRVVLINPAACTHLGVRARDVIELEPSACFSALPLFASDGEQIDADSVLESSLEREMVVQLRSADRAPRWLEFHTVMHGHDSNTLLVSTRDVTEERRVESLRTEVVGLVSHDLRAPLTVIAGYLDLLTHDIDAEARTKAVASAQRSAVRMQDLLEDLLAATRAEEMFAPTEFARVDLRDLAEEVVVSFQHTSPHQLAVRADCPGVVLGEEKRLRQVLVNLVTNAMKYSPDGARIDVAVECDHGKVLLSVEDNGLGVPEAQRDKIFDRFTRLSSEDGTKQPGVGLGLYIVRAIVESHGGTVVATSRLDGQPGARFEVTLPVAPAAK